LRPRTTRYSASNPSPFSVGSDSSTIIASRSSRNGSQRPSGSSAAFAITTGPNLVA